jgi:N6-L-threonylcarbamoyladenine synthase
MIVLGIESSCDDTAVALYSKERGLLANLVSSQVEHGRYGGVVPELASRAHLVNLSPLLEAALQDADIVLSDLEGIAVTQGPGLIGSLLVGVSFGKALAYAEGVPLVGVHHIEAHILVNELESEMEFPCVALVVSGGHTMLIHCRALGSYEILGGTRDDAAGEALDKIAKLLDLGYPGGPVLERQARRGTPGKVSLPRGMIDSSDLDFSFSGLKTAVRLLLTRHEGEVDPADVAAEVQEAVFEPLAAKTVRAVRTVGVEQVYLAGGVAANQRLRRLLEERLGEEGVRLGVPARAHCTDNGAMVACAGELHFRHGRTSTLGLDPFARGPIKSWAA